MPHDAYPMNYQVPTFHEAQPAPYAQPSSPTPHDYRGPITASMAFPNQPELAAMLERGSARNAYGTPHAPPPAYVGRPAMPYVQQPQAQRPARVQAPPQSYAADHLTRQLEQLRGDINAHLAKHPVQNNAGRLVTIVGTMGAIGAGVATGVAVFGGAFAGITGIGIPVAAAAALSGVGVGLAGIGLAAMAGAATRALARRNVAKNPELRERIVALQHIQGELLAKKSLTPAEKTVLRNVNTVLGKVGGAKAHIKSQLKLAGKTTLVSTLSVGLLAVLAIATEGSNGFVFWGASPLPMPSGAGGTEGRPLQAAHEGDGAQMNAWTQQLYGAGAYT